jgi:tRNA nucleotidyltransferase (CCA-adding enzyme)
MTIPNEVLKIIQKLTNASYEAYIVGGCLRDCLLGIKPKDWDITTSAKPKEIQKLFKKSFYDNNFGTVGVPTDSQDDSLKVIEITTFRTEAKYSDKRHPDKIQFAKTIEEDLKRRDFTMNALAACLKKSSLNKEVKISNLEIIDPFKGKKDIKEGILRTVGKPEDRFKEDALRLMRAVRFATELNLTIEEKTFKAIQKNAPLLKEIANERIRDELIKIFKSTRAHFGIMYLHEAGLLKYIIPEFEEGIGVSQNHHHPYDCYYHGIYSLEYAAQQNYSLEIRVAALLHDIGKPYVKESLGEHSTFYNHAQYGAKMTKTILKRLRFSSDFIKKVAHLVNYHLFYYDIDVVTESGIRRLLRRLGKENIEDFIKLRTADRIGSRVPKAKPYRLRHLEYMFEKVATDPIDPKMLKIDGNEIMAMLKLKPGPKIGLLMEALLQEVLDDPAKNNQKYLKKRVREINKLSQEELEKKSHQIDEIKKQRDEKRKEKYWVK